MHASCRNSASTGVGTWYAGQPNAVSARSAPPPLALRALLPGWLALGVPLLAGGWLLLDAQRNQPVALPAQHFFVVTVVALLALGVALLVARVALRMEQYRVALLSLGFGCMAGFFAVHALATPGISVGTVVGYADSSYAGPYGTSQLQTDRYAGTVVGLSAFLSLAVPAGLFALAFSPVAGRLRRGAALAGVGVLALLIAAYGAAAAWQPEAMGSLPFSRPPFSSLLAAVSVGLLLFGAGRQWQVYRRTRFPTHGSLVLAFLLLAEAQVAMVAAPFWTPTWWLYHVLMLAAVVLALGALFVELDRRRGLERFLPGEVVERVVAGDLLRLGGERRVATVLFADLRGSTALAEKLPAEAVVDLLNAYVGALARPVFEHGGMLDKYMGDGLMAVFGVVDEGDHGARAAARAALDMRAAIARVNQERRADVRFGVGIHTGEVVLGAVGIPQRSDFTAIGDTVNTASRLEGLCKTYGVDTVLSAATRDCLDGAVRVTLLGATEIRGRAQPEQVFTLKSVE